MTERNPGMRIRVGNDPAAIEAARGIIGRVLGPNVEVKVDAGRTQAHVSASQRNIPNRRR